MLFNESKIIKRTLIAYATISMFLIGLMFIFKLHSTGMLYMDFCFEADCISYFFLEINRLAELADYLLKFAVGLVTIVGVYVALKNYLTTVNTARINIHLSHLTTFKEYLAHEQENYSHVSKNSINVFKLYNLIYPESRDGILNVGKKYVEGINEINLKISESNHMVRKTGDLFNYKKHQTKIIESLDKVGITIARLPQNDFYTVENDVFDLINKINREFCMLSDDCQIRERTYR